jgi:O-antigen ligase
LGYSQAAKPLIIPKDDINIGQAFSVLIDNMYLALTLHIGFIGMVIVVALMWAMWRRLRIETIRRPSPLLIGIASFWSVFLLNNMFNISPAMYGYWFVIAMMVLQRDQSPAEPEWDRALEPVAAQ